MENKIDFKGLSQELLQRAPEILSELLPNGRLVGNEFVVGNLRNEPGDSLKFNIVKGYGQDFATGETFGDIIDLTAKVLGISESEAARQLDNGIKFETSARSAPTPTPSPIPEPEVMMPPDDASECDFKHHVFGEPIMFWPYLTAERKLMFYVARYERDGKKQVLPWSWSVKGGWILKSFPTPRPLFGLELLAERPKDLVLIVEGEKTCMAARELLGQKYVCISWCGGAHAFKKSDWSPVFGTRGILISPDADMAGIRARDGIAEIFKGHCDHIKILTPVNMPEGWDLADALHDGWSTDQVIEWARSCVSIYWKAFKEIKTVSEAELPAIVPELAKVMPPKPDSVPVIAKNAIIEKAQVIAENVIVQEEPEPEPTPVIAKNAIIKGSANVIAENVYTNDDAPAELTQSAEYWMDTLGIARQKNKTPFYNMDNARRVIENHKKYKGKIWFDDFHQKIFIDVGNGKCRPWKNEDAIFLMGFMQREIGLSKISKENIEHAALMVAKMNPKNEPKDWMNSLVWDGEERLKNLFVKYYGASDTVYVKAAGRNWLIGMVARIFKPGCAVQNMPIIEGPQGLLKSRSIKAIGGKWYAESNGTPDNKDFFMNLHGKMVIEIAELDSFRKVEDTLIKKLLTQDSDFFRPPYGYVSEDFPRQCVFVGTTNEEDYLKDSTGGRRFWPIRAHKILLSDIERDRDQFFAEAVHRYKAGESWWVMPLEEALEEQEKRRVKDGWGDAVAAYLLLKDDTTVNEIAVEVLKIEIAKNDSGVQRRIGKILRLLGWDKRDKRVNGHVVNVWYRKPAEV